MRNDLVRFGDVFDELLNYSRGYRFVENIYSPPCDLEETEDNYLLNLDVPGVSKNEIQIEVHGRQLKISGDRKLQPRETKENSGVRFAERAYGKFERVFNLPDTVESDKIEANYTDGVLSVVVPKAEVLKPRQIRIGDGGHRAA